MESYYSSHKKPSKMYTRKTCFIFLYYFSLFCRILLRSTIFKMLMHLASTAGIFSAHWKFNFPRLYGKVVYSRLLLFSVSKWTLFLGICYRKRYILYISDDYETYVRGYIWKWYRNVSESVLYVPFGLLCFSVDFLEIKPKI